MSQPECHAQLGLKVKPALIFISVRVFLVVYIKQYLWQLYEQKILICKVFSRVVKNST